MNADQIDHRAIIASLSASDRAVLTGLTNRDGIMRAAMHFGAILLLGAAILARVPLWPLLLPVQGILVVFLFTAMHETIHGTAFRSARLNRAVSTVSGFLVFIPAVWFRYFHFAHHRHTHDPDNDPELMSRKPETTVAQYVLYLSGLPLWTSMAKGSPPTRSALRTRSTCREKAKAKVRLEARITVAAYRRSPLPRSCCGRRRCCGRGSCRSFSVSRSCAPICWPSMHAARMSRTCWKTPAPPSPPRWFASLPGTCRSMPSTMPIRRCRSTSCRAFTSLSREHLRTTERGYVRFNRKFAGGLH